MLTQHDGGCLSKIPITQSALHKVCIAYLCQTLQYDTCIVDIDSKGV